MSCDNWCNSRNFKTKNHDELGLHTLIERMWRSKPTFFHKIANALLPEYLYSYLKFSSQENYRLRSASNY